MGCNGMLLGDVMECYYGMQEVHTAAIRSLAEVTAHSIQHLLRAGEKTLLCLPDQEVQSSSLEQSSTLAQ